MALVSAEPASSRVPLRPPGKALVLPVDALRGDQAAANAVVLVDRDGRVEERPVRLGLRTLAAAEVLDGLSAGETVLRGSTLKPGSRVRAVAAGADRHAPARIIPYSAPPRHEELPGTAAALPGAPLRRRAA